MAIFTNMNYKYHNNDDDIDILENVNNFTPLLEFNLEIKYKGQNLKLTLEPLVNGKRSPYRIKIPVTNNNKHINYETMFLPEYYKTGNIVHHDGKPCNHQLNSKQLKILKNILDTNKDDIYDFLNKKIDEHDLRKRLSESHIEYKIDI